MKKQLIYQNDNLLSEIITDLSQYKPLLNAVKTTYEKLQIGNFSNDTLQEITQRNIDGIDKIYFQKQEDDFSKMGVSNEIIKQNVLNGANDLFNEFLIATNNLKKFKPTTYSRHHVLRPNQISFEDNVFYISDENKEHILESCCREYLQSEKDFELYNNLNALIEAYDKVSDNLKDLNFMFSPQREKGLAAVQNVFLKFTENSFEVVPGSIASAVNQSENRLKFNS